MLVDMALTQGFRNHLNFCSKRNYKLKIVMNIWAVGLDYYMLGSYTMEITAEREREREREQKKGNNIIIKKERVSNTHTLPIDAAMRKQSAECRQSPS